MSTPCELYGYYNSEQIGLHRNAALPGEEAWGIVDLLAANTLVAFRHRRALHVRDPRWDVLNLCTRVEALDGRQPLPLILSPGGPLDISQTLLSHFRTVVTLNNVTVSLLQFLSWRLNDAKC